MTDTINSQIFYEINSDAEYYDLILGMLRQPVRCVRCDVLTKTPYLLEPDKRYVCWRCYESE